LSGAAVSRTAGGTAPGSRGGGPEAPKGWFGRWCGEAPADRLGAVRILSFGFALVYLLIRAPAVMAVTSLEESRFVPVGPVVLLSRPVGAGTTFVLLVVTTVALLGATLGYRWRLSGPVAALGVLWLLSYRLSWGQVLHTENLLVLHLLILAGSPAADAMALDSGRRDPGRTPDRGWVYGWVLQLMGLVTVLGYALAGYAKLRNGGMAWLNGDVLGSHIALDNLRKALFGEPYSPLGGWLTRFGFVFAPMAWGAMVLELGGVVALWPGRLRRLWVWAVWGFHVTVLALMAIVFPYQLSGVAFASFSRPEIILRSGRRALTKALRGGSASGPRDPVVAGP